MKTRILIISACLLLAGLASQRAATPAAVPPRVSLAEFPLQVGEWRVASAPRLDHDVLQVLGVNDYLNRVYRAPDGRLLGLYIGYYASQRQGDTIHSPLNCLPGAGWEPMKRERIRLNVAAGPGAGAARRTITVNRILVEKGLDRAVVLYWYEAHGRVVASEYWGKVYMVLDAIRLNRTDGALVRIISLIGSDGVRTEAQADDAAREMARDIAPMLDRYIPR